MDYEKAYESIDKLRLDIHKNNSTYENKFKKLKLQRDKKIRMRLEKSKN